MGNIDFEDIKVVKLNRSSINEIVELHCAVFDEKENNAKLIGGNFIKKTYEFFIDDDQSFSFGAYLNNKLVGIIFGRLTYYISDLNKYTPRRIAFIDSYIKSITNFKKFFQITSLLIKKTIKKNNTINMVNAPSHIEGKTATLASFGVLDSKYSSKIADRLLSVAKNFCIKKNKKILRAGVKSNNIKSRFFYKKRGFEEDKILSDSENILYYKLIKST
tara:strand:+ start:6922 stop:7575 length:654 start_codon:yes stop_codon:yes gene_type:complete